MAVNSRTNKNNMSNLPTVRDNNSNPLGVRKPKKEFSEDEKIELNKELLKNLKAMQTSINLIGQEKFLEVQNKLFEKENDEKKLQELHNDLLSLTDQLKKGELSNSEYALKVMDNKKEQDEIKNKESLEFHKKIEEYDAKVKEFFQGAVKNINKVIDKNSNALRGAFLGPINLLTSPFEEFFGGSVFDGIKGLFTKGKDFAKKLTKKHPKEVDLLKNHEYTGIYIIDKLQEMFKNKKKEDDKSEFLKSILSGGGLGALFGGKGLSALFGGSKLSKLINPKTLGIGGIASGLLLMIIDGIKGVFKSKEWGTSKLSSFLGGFFGGTMDGGIKSAFSNMGKWALLGAGVGSVVPVVGTIAGGIIGAVIGGILGFFGGKKIAQGFDKLGSFFKNSIVPIYKEMFMSIIEPLKNIKNIWKGDSSFAKKLGATVRQLGIFILRLLLKPFQANNKVLNIFGKYITDAFKNGGTSIKNAFVGIIKSIFDFLSNLDFKDLLGKGVKGFIDINDKMIGFAWDFFAGLFNSTLDWETAKEKMKNVLDEYLINPIKNFFYYLGDFFSFAREISMVDAISMMAKGTFGDEFTKYHQQKMKDRVVDVNDAIIKSDGTIIRTSVDDNIIATKNIPQNLSSIRVDNQKDLNNNLKYTSVGNNVVDKMDKIINVLSAILDKDVKVVLPSQTRSDLACLIGGR